MSDTEILCAFHSTKTFENFETAANGTEISWKSFQKLLNFRNENHSTENFRISGSKVEWKENFREIFFENLGIPRHYTILKMSESHVFQRNFKEDCIFNRLTLICFRSGGLLSVLSGRKFSGKHKKHYKSEVLLSQDYSPDCFP